MSRLLRFGLYVLTVALLVYCGGTPFLLSTPQPASVISASPSPAPTQPAPSAGPQVLRLWIPARFDPNSDSEASHLFRSRLDDFAARHPGLTLDIRIKPEDGLLESLSLTHAAAPAALPDLVALPRADLEDAVLKGILKPVEGLTASLHDPDWFAYARSLGDVQNAAYGLPFAGDALALIYRPSKVSPPPLGWEDVISRRIPFAFAVADPQALFVTSLYLSANGTLLNERGLPGLDPAPLTETLTLLDQVVRGGEIPSSALAFEADDQVWQAFRERRVPLAVTRISHCLHDLPEDARCQPLPGLQETPYTLADGWLWGLAGSDPKSQALAVELANSLVESDFLAAWTESAGYLPPRPNALAAWQNEENRMLAEAVVQSAQAVPLNDVLLAVGPVLQEAALGVLRGEVSVAAAVQQAADRLK